MDSKCSLTVSCSKDKISKSDILALSQLLCRLAADQCSVSQENLGRGISIFDNQQCKRFDSPEELQKNFPPLEPIAGFQVSAIYGHIFFGKGPGISLQVIRQPASDTAGIFVSAMSAAAAQELALKIAESPPFLPEQHHENKKRRKTKKRDQADRNNEKPQKFDQSSVFWGAVGGIGTFLGIVITLLIHFGVF